MGRPCGLLQEPIRPNYSVSIHPNPVSSEATLSISGLAPDGRPCRFMAYDMLGRLAAQRDIAGPEDRLQLADLKDGIYTYIIMQENGNTLGNGLLEMKKDGQ